MLTPVEQMLFILLALFALGATYVGFKEMYEIIMRGQRELYLDQLPQRVINALRIYLAQTTTLKMRRRRVTSLFHLAVVWGFTYYFLVNVADLLRRLHPGLSNFWQTPGVARRCLSAARRPAQRRRAGRRRLPDDPPLLPARAQRTDLSRQRAAPSEGQGGRRSAATR